jgi:hypothetical protein
MHMKPLWSGEPQEAAPDPPPPRRHASLYEAEYAKQLRRIERIRKAVGGGDAPIPPRRPHRWDEPPPPAPQPGEAPEDPAPFGETPAPPAEQEPVAPPRADDVPSGEGAGPSPERPAEEPPDTEERAEEPPDAGEAADEPPAGESPQVPRSEEPWRPRPPAEPSPAARRARLAAVGLGPRERRVKRVHAINGHMRQPPRSEPAVAGTHETSSPRWAIFGAGLALLGIGALAVALLIARGGGPRPDMVALPGPATDLVAGDGHLWAAAPQAGAVWVLDGRSGDPVAPAIRIQGTPARLAADGRQAWAADTANATVVRLRGARVPVPVGADVADVSIAGGRVWTASADDGMVRVLDAGGHHPRAIKVGGHPAALCSDARSVVVVSSDGAIAWLDARARKGVAAVRVGGTPIAAAMSGGAAWFVDTRGGTVRRASLRSGAATSGGASGGGPVAGGASSIVVGPAIAVGRRPVAIAAAGSELFVASRGDRSVAVVDARHGVVTRRIALGIEPAAIAVAGDYVWVAAAGRSAMARIDRRRLT